MAAAPLPWRTRCLFDVLRYQGSMHSDQQDNPTLTLSNVARNVHAYRRDDWRNEGALGTAELGHPVEQ